MQPEGAESLEERQLALRRETVAKRKAALATSTTAMAAAYPTAAHELWHHHNTVCARLDAELPASQKVSLEVSAEQNKRDYWEVLKILSKADPTLPIVELHNEVCAEIDVVIADARETLARMAAEAERFKDHMRNVMIAYHVGGEAAAQEETAAFERGE